MTNKLPFLVRGNRIARKADGRSAEHIQIENHERFARFLNLEKKRAARSGISFMVAHIGMGQLSQEVFVAQIVPSIVGILETSIRETDIVGWSKDASGLSVLFTEISSAEEQCVQTILGRLAACIHRAIGVTTPVSLACQVYSQVDSRIPCGIDPMPAQPPAVRSFV